MRAEAALLPALLAASACALPQPEERAAPPPPPILSIPAPPAMATPTPPPVAPLPAWIAGSRVPEFRKCAACHMVEQGATNGVGPNLYGVFGRPAATVRPDYRYSPALAVSGLVWDFATLDRWLAGPRVLVPGTKMVFHGLRNPEERKAIIAFLRLRSAARP